MPAEQAHNHHKQHLPSLCSALADHAQTGRFLLELLTTAVKSLFRLSFAKIARFNYLDQFMR